jgi:quercetin dioxygenase-like cupin family protein
MEFLPSHGLSAGAQPFDLWITRPQHCSDYSRATEFTPAALSRGASEGRSMSAGSSHVTAGVVRTGQGDQFELGGHTFTFKCLAQETGGGAFIWLVQSAPGAVIPLHIHRVEDELVYMIDGQLEATLGDQKHSLAAGDLLKMPKGLAHSIRVLGGAAATTLWTALPAGKMEGFFRALSELPTDRPPDPEEIARISREHDMETLETLEG